MIFTDLWSSMNTKVVYSFGFPISVVSRLCSWTVAVELSRSHCMDLVSELQVVTGMKPLSESCHRSQAGVGVQFWTLCCVFPLSRSAWVSGVPVGCSCAQAASQPLCLWASPRWFCVLGPGKAQPLPQERPWAVPLLGEAPQTPMAGTAYSLPKLSITARVTEPISYSP